MRNRYTLTAPPADRETAVTAYREPCRAGLTIAPAVTLAAMKTWSAWPAAREAWPEVAAGYGQGLAASDRLYGVQLLPDAMQTWRDVALDVRGV